MLTTTEPSTSTLNQADEAFNELNCCDGVYELRECIGELISKREDALLLLRTICDCIADSMRGPTLEAELCRLRNFNEIPIDRISEQQLLADLVVVIRQVSEGETEETADTLRAMVAAFVCFAMGHLCLKDLTPEKTRPVTAKDICSVSGHYAQEALSSMIRSRDDALIYLRRLVEKNQLDPERKSNCGSIELELLYITGLINSDGDGRNLYSKAGLLQALHTLASHFGSIDNDDHPALLIGIIAHKADFLFP